MTDTGDSARIDALEAHCAHQDLAITELSDAVAAQWKQIDALKREVLRLRDEMQSMAPARTAPEPPPRLLIVALLKIYVLHAGMGEIYFSRGRVMNIPFGHRVADEGIAALRRQIYAKDKVSRAEFELALAHDGTGPEFAQLLCDIAIDLLVNQADPPEYIQAAAPTG